MCTVLQTSGKRTRETLAAESASLPPSYRLFIKDRPSCTQFLVDTGSEVSVYPHRGNTTTKMATGYQLIAANGTPINTFGIITINLNIGLRRALTWRFIVADVSRPIIGADLLSHYGLLVDLKNQRLIDETTWLRTTGTTRSVDVQSIKLQQPNKSTEFWQVLAEFPKVTRPDGAPTHISHTTQHHIKTTPGPPVSSRARRLAPDRLKIAKAEFDKMIKLGIARPSDSSWASPLHLAPKKFGEWRPCGDYRRLNERTIPDRYPVRCLEDFTANLHGTSCYSTIDLIRAFNQIPVAEQDVEKTAIITPFGLFEFPFMTFGLRNAAQTFQRFIDEVTRDLPFVFAYIDDLLVASANETQHKQHLRIVLQRLQRYGLVINASKTRLGLKEVEFLGHTISAHGIKPLADRVKAIVDYPRPSTITKLRNFIGTINFYRKFIKHAADLLAPLNNLLKGPNISGKTPINWTTLLENSFAACKKALANATLLAHPDHNAEWAIFSDASECGIGAALQQRSGDHWQPLAFFSRKLVPSVQKRSTYDRELNAIYEAVQYFRHIFEGRHIVIYTDHKPIMHAFKQKPERAAPWQFRRLEFISQFTTDIRHISGSNNIVADALSRVDAIHVAVTSEEIARAQTNDTDLQQLLRSSNTSLELRKIRNNNGDVAVYCDISTGTARPFVPQPLRRQIFDALHSVSHPGRRASRRLITSRFVWPSVNKDCISWAKACIQCQRNKIARHTVSPIAIFQPPSRRFEHIHIDLVTLPLSKGHTKCLTIMDRFTRYPSAAPLIDGSVDRVAHALMQTWVSYFGVPLRITTDLGGQFESDLFKKLADLLGFKHQRTTSYHPQSNGLVERFHRQLKSSLLCHGQSWYDALPAVLLGLRAAFKEDIKATPAEMVFGEPIRLPGEFLAPSTQNIEAPELVKTLRKAFQNITPIPASRHRKEKIFVSKELENSSHVFIRNDKVRQSFSSPYDGPFPVVKRDNKFYKVLFHGKPTQISIDRLKPAFLCLDESEHLNSNLPGKSQSSKNYSDTNTNLPTMKERSQKRVRFQIPPK